MDSASKREGGSNEETDSASEWEDGSYFGTSGSDDANPGPVILPNDEAAFSSTPQFLKDKVDLVKLELVNLVLEIGAPLHLFNKICPMGCQGQLLWSHIQARGLLAIQNLPKRPH
jgi:hypothetical protein